MPPASFGFDPRRNLRPKITRRRDTFGQDGRLPLQRAQKLHFLAAIQTGIQMSLYFALLRLWQEAINVIVQTVFHFIAAHFSSASRNSLRARCNWAFEVPSAMPMRAAI